MCVDSHALTVPQAHPPLTLGWALARLGWCAEHSYRSINVSGTEAALVVEMVALLREANPKMPPDWRMRARRFLNVTKDDDWLG